MAVHRAEGEGVLGSPSECYGQFSSVIIIIIIIIIIVDSIDIISLSLFVLFVLLLVLLAVLRLRGSEARLIGMGSVSLGSDKSAEREGVREAGGRDPAEEAGGDDHL